jgi:hypothetical protein
LERIIKKIKPEKKCILGKAYIVYETDEQKHKRKKKAISGSNTKQEQYSGRDRDEAQK